MIIYDISQQISEKIAVWPGEQEFRQHWTMQIRRGGLCNVSSVTMSLHTGTHVDAPYHFDESGLDISAVSLHYFLGPARLIAVPEGQKLIKAAFLRQFDWRGVERILFKTRASELLPGQFQQNFVSLSEDGAEFLGQQKIVLVGTDAPSIDHFNNKDLPCHKILLRYGAAILEGADFAQVPEADYELICLPLKFMGLDGSPVRAILRQLDNSPTRHSI